MFGYLYILGGLAVGVYCLWTGLQGLASGVIVDTGRHHSTAYTRAHDPLAYWLLETGRLVLGLLLVPLYGGGLLRKVRPTHPAEPSQRNADPPP